MKKTINKLHDMRALGFYKWQTRGYANQTNFKKTLAKKYNPWYNIWEELEQNADNIASRKTAEKAGYIIAASSASIKINSGD